MPDSFNSAPIPRKHAFVVFEPEGCRGRNLWSRCRCAFAVETKDGGTAESRPGDVWRVSSNRGRHAAVRPEVSLKRRKSLEIRVRLAVGHHSNNGDDSVIASGINNMACRQAIHVVARGRNDAKAAQVRFVYSIAPGSRRKAAHAQRNN